MVIYHPDTIQSAMNGALITSSRTGKGLGIKTGTNPACYGQAAWKEIKVRPSTDSIDTLLHSSYGVRSAALWAAKDLRYKPVALFSSKS